MNKTALKKILFRSLILLTALGFALGIGGGVALLSLYQQLPDVQKLEDYTLPQATTIYSQSGELLTRTSTEGRYDPIRIDQLPQHVVDAVITAEDRRFWEHDGIDYWGVLRAFVSNLKNPNHMQGASTLTQQLIKNLFLTPERTAKRKIAEALLAVQLEQKYTKHQIVELYLNMVFLGHNVYGVEAASQIYFGKSAKNLSVAQAAMLAGIIRSPEYFSPYHRPEDAHKLKEIVLKQMLEDGRITQEDHDKALTEKIRLVGLRTSYRFPYFLDYVMYTLHRDYGDVPFRQGGWKVYTTLDPAAQEYAENLLKRRQGWLGQRKASQAALVSMDPHNGYIKAMVGGVDYRESQFNRAFQAQRQVGSTFKPFVYLTAFLAGKTLKTTLQDKPVNFGGYRPRNYDRRYHGEVTLLSALTHSLNIPTVILANQLGMSNITKVVRMAGVTSPIEDYLTSALGASEMNLLELTSAYGSFANGGLFVKPTAITRIEDAEGRVIFDYFPVKERIYDKDAIKQLNYALQNVIEAGTAKAARIGRPAAGKTGTTDKSYDTWFVGYTPQLVTGVWAGNDKPSATLGGGGTVGAPIWREYMQFAVRTLPIKGFDEPASLEPSPTPEPSGNEVLEVPTEGESPAAKTTPTPEPVSSASASALSNEVEELIDLEMVQPKATPKTTTPVATPEPSGAPQ